MSSILVVGSMALDDIETPLVQLLLQKINNLGRHPSTRLWLFFVKEGLGRIVGFTFGQLKDLRFSII